MRPWLMLTILLALAAGCGDDACDDTCPDCGTLEGAAPPAGTDLRCVKGGVDHGPSRTWYGDGTLRRQGGYQQGQKCGDWTDWLPGGQVAAEEEYDACRWSQRYWSGPFSD